MTRAAWALVFLLVVSNTLWFLAWSGRPEPAADVNVEILERDQTIADLELEGEVLRDAAAGPAGPGLEPAPAPVLGTEDDVRVPDVERGEAEQEAVAAREAEQRVQQAARASMQASLEYALGALYQVRGLEIDRAMFRELVLPLLGSEHGGVRRSALYALSSTDPAAAELRFALAAATDPDPRVRGNAARFMSMYGGSNIEGEAATAVVGLL